MKKLPIIFVAGVLAFSAAAQAKSLQLLNVSYDPTREFYEAYNKGFAADWKKKTGDDVRVQQSHGGSGKQARTVIDGLQADVVTLALSFDIDAIAEKTKLLPIDWQQKLPHHSSPYTSTIVFLVKKGNPKHVKDWSDLVRSDIKVITPNPKTSGGARWSYLAAYGYALKKFGNDEAKATEFLKQLYANVPIFDTGARGATTTFALRNIGDVLITWENEAQQVQEQMGKGRFEIVVPSISILAEPPVSVVDKVANKKGTLELARAYLKGLYGKDAQRLVAKFGYRPSDPAVAKEFAAKFPKIELTRIDDFGGWKAAQQKHFDEGGVFDQITKRQ